MGATPAHSRLHREDAYKHTAKRRVLLYRMAHSEECVGRRGASRLSKLEIGHDAPITHLRNHSFESPNAEGRSDCAPALGVCLAEGKANAVDSLFNTHVKSASPPISASCVLKAMSAPVNDTANKTVPLSQIPNCSQSDTSFQSIRAERIVRSTLRAQEGSSGLRPLCLCPMNGTNFPPRCFTVSLLTTRGTSANTAISLPTTSGTGVLPVAVYRMCFMLLNYEGRGSWGMCHVFK